MDTKNNKKKNIITITLTKAVIIVATAILASAGTAVWGTLAVANTIPFRVSALENDISQLKPTLTDIAVMKNDIINIKEHVQDIKKIVSDWKLDQ